MEPGGPRSPAEEEVDRRLRQAADKVADLYWSFNARDVIDAVPNKFQTRHAHRTRLRRLRSVRVTGTVLVAAVILAVFLVPLPHVSLFRRLITPAKSSTPTSVPTTTSLTGTSVPVKVPPTLRQSHCSDGDVVDASSHVHFAPLRVLCIGTVWSGNGVVSHGDLYAVTTPSATSTSSFRLVKISLSTYHVLRSSVFHGNYSAPVVAFGALWVVNWPPDSNSQRLLEFSEGNLRLLKQIPGGYDLVAFGSWFWSVAIGGELERLDPLTGVSTVVPLGSLPPHATVSGIAAVGSSLLLSTAGPQAADSETVVYQPGFGVTRQVPAPDASVEQSDRVFAATPDVVWVVPPGMNVHSVNTFSAQTLLRLPGGFQQGGPNGTWTAVLSAGDLWFELGGAPLVCVSGVSGFQSAALRLPGSVQTDNLAESHAPAFVAAGNGEMVTGAWLNTPHGPVASGLAFYRLDPRCEQSNA